MSDQQPPEDSRIEVVSTSQKFNLLGYSNSIDVFCSIRVGTKDSPEKALDMGIDFVRVGIVKAVSTKIGLKGKQLAEMRRRLNKEIAEEHREDSIE